MAVNVDLLNSNNINNISTNFERVETALQDVIGRSGTTPNQMNSDFDMNSNDILNAASIDTELLYIGGQLVVPIELGSIAPNSVGTDQIVDGAVTWDKLDSNIAYVVPPTLFGADLSGTVNDRLLVKQAWQYAVANGLPFIVPLFADNNPLVIQVPEDFANHQLFTEAVRNWIVPQGQAARGTTAHVIQPTINVSTLGIIGYNALNWTYNLPSGLWESIEFTSRNFAGYTLASTPVVVSGPSGSGTYDIDITFTNPIPTASIGHVIKILLPVAETHTGDWRVIEGGWPIVAIPPTTAANTYRIRVKSLNTPSLVFTLEPGKGIFTHLNGGIRAINLPSNGADIGVVDVHYGIRANGFVIAGDPTNSADTDAMMGRYGAKVFLTDCVLYGGQRAALRIQNGEAYIPGSSFMSSTWGLNAVGSKVIGNSHCAFSGNTSQGLVLQQKSGVELTQPMIHGNGGQGILITNDSSLLIGGGAHGSIEYNQTGIEVDASSFINRTTIRIGNNTGRAWLIRKGGRMLHTNVTDVTGTQDPAVSTYGALEGGGFNLIEDGVADVAMFQKGTFIPVISIGGSSVGITYNAATIGRWQKSGDWIDVSMYIRLTSKGGLTGDVLVTNLPFIHLNATPLTTTGDIQFVSLASAIASLTARNVINTDDLALYKSGAVSVAALGGADITDTTELYIHTRYPFR